MKVRFGNPVLIDMKLEDSSRTFHCFCTPFGVECVCEGHTSMKNCLAVNAPIKYFSWQGSCRLSQGGAQVGGPNGW